MKLGTRTVSAQVTEPKHKVNVNTLEKLAATRLELNEIGVCNLALSAPIAYDPYAENKDLGGFILIDRMSNRTVG
ncbi:sulfate adenylyltransferase subunit CysN, partial [Shewanella sp. A25]|nr:sulfate adenylyltransferase subunit CysN [Shewanella shenzhenensis]